MWQWLREDIQWRHKLGFNSKARHHMPGILMQWREYMNQVATIADVEPIPDVVEKIFKYCLVVIMLKGLTQAKSTRFIMTADKSNFSVRPFSFLVSFVYYVVLLLTAIGIIQ